jgi:oxygen-independent coproporphyrinogen-3 oxidase
VLPERYVEATRSIETNAERTSAFSSWGVWGERMEERISPQNLELLDAQTLLRERIMLGLRISDGLDVDEAGQDLGAPGWTPERERAADWLAERGRIVRRGARVSVPAGEAWLWTDDTAARLF